MVRIILTALTLIASIPVAAQQVRLEANETLLQVEAEGGVKAVPDVASFSTGVTSDGTSARAALDANSAVANRLISALRAADVPDIAMRTEGLTVRPRYKPDKDGDDSDEIIGYRASNNLKIRLIDISTAPGVIDALIRAGATDLSGPKFEFSDVAPLKKRARAKAVIAAGAEAADYAAALGMRINRVLRVSERSASGMEAITTSS